MVDIEAAHCIPFVVLDIRHPLCLVSNCAARFIVRI